MDSNGTLHASRLPLASAAPLATITITLNGSPEVVRLLAEALAYFSRPVAAQPRPEEHFRHSHDYRECHWHGRRFRFSKSQAAVVETLDRAREDGRPEVPQESLMHNADSEQVRLFDLFRRTAAADAWGTMIVPGSAPGTYRLED
jgi:hypothetical protein